MIRRCLHSDKVGRILCSFKSGGGGGELLSNSSRSFSAEAAAVATPLSFFRTSETDPTKLSDNHLGRFYSVEDDVYKKLFAQHHGFPSQFRELCAVFREQCILVRKPYLDIKNCVDGLNLEKPVVRFLIYGPSGAGKTMTLANMVHYGYTKEFILFHVPWVPLFTRWAQEIVPSILRPGYFNHTIDAVAWLTHFKTQNTELITRLNLTTGSEYVWNKRETTPKDSPLLNIVDHGIGRPAYAADCIVALSKELKELSSQQRCKTMVLLEGINAIYHPTTQLHVEKRKRYPSSEVTVYEAFTNLSKTDWTGGVVIATVDKLAVGSDFRESSLPRYLLQREGWDLFDPFVPVEVTNYSSQELQTAIDYYLDRKWLGHPAAATPEGRLELEYISTRNPLELMLLCNSR